MWQVTLVSVIVAFIGLLFFGYLSTKNGVIAAKQDKVEALEKAAEQDRAEERRSDEKKADEIRTAGDVDTAMDFLRDSFKAGS